MRLNSSLHAAIHPDRLVVVRNQGVWEVWEGGERVALHPTQPEAFADAWARTRPKEDT